MGEWHRQPGETSKAYAAFCCYRDAGPARTLIAGWLEYRQLAKLKSAKPSSAFERWAKEHEWELRAAAYDNDVTDAVVANGVEVLERARRVYLDAAEDVAEAMVAMALGFAEADNARIAAARDILDRVGFVRKRAGLAGVIAGGGAVVAENAQFNFDLSGLTPQQLAQLATVLTDEG